MLVAVNISNRNIKIVAVDKSRVMNWETVILPEGLVKDGLIIQPQVVSGLLIEAFENSRLPREGIAASVTGLSFIYRILNLPKLNSQELPEAISRAMQKEINVPVNDLYIDWQVVREQSGSLDIFVLGAPRNMVDAVLVTFKAAKLRLSSLDLNSLALARLAGRSKALIADLDPDWFDIVIVAGGLPVTLHSVAPKGNYRELEDNLAQMSDEIRRTVEFFNLTHKDLPIGPDEPVILSGAGKFDQSETDLIQRYLPSAGFWPDGHWTAPQGFSSSDYSVALGLLLKSSDNKLARRTAGSGYQDINLNLLAGRERIKQVPFSIKRLVVPAAIVLAVLVLTPLMLIRNAAVSENRVLQTELNRLNHSLNVRRLSLAESDASLVQINRYQTDAASIQNERDLISGPGDLAEELKTVLNGLGEQVNYSGLVSSSSQIIVDGQAADRTLVLEFTSYLETQKLFKEVRIASIEESGPGSAQNAPTGGPVSYKIILER